MQSLFSRITALTAESEAVKWIEAEKEISPKIAKGDVADVAKVVEKFAENYKGSKAFWREVEKFIKANPNKLNFEEISSFALGLGAASWFLKEDYKIDQIVEEFLLDKIAEKHAVIKRQVLIEDPYFDQKRVEHYDSLILANGYDVAFTSRAMNSAKSLRDAKEAYGLVEFQDGFKPKGSEEPKFTENIDPKVKKEFLEYLEQVETLIPKEKRNAADEFILNMVKERVGILPHDHDADFASAEVKVDDKSGGKK